MAEVIDLDCDKLERYHFKVSKPKHKILAGTFDKRRQETVLDGSNEPHERGRKKKLC